MAGLCMIVFYKRRGDIRELFCHQKTKVSQSDGYSRGTKILWCKLVVYTSQTQCILFVFISLFVKKKEHEK